jgi:hypothetical protein
MTNTKARHLEIYKAAVKIVEKSGGVEMIDALPKKQRVLKLRDMALAVTGATSCTRETARRNIAKAMSQARFAVMQDQRAKALDNWGGPRTPGPGKKLGPPQLSKNQKRERLSTRLAPGSKELAQAIAKVLGLPGWGHAVDVALVLMVEGDQELKVKLGEMGFSDDRSRDN